MLDDKIDHSRPQPDQCKRVGFHSVELCLLDTITPSETLGRCSRCFKTGNLKWSLGELDKNLAFIEEQEANASKLPNRIRESLVSHHARWRWFNAFHRAHLLGKDVTVEFPQRTPPTNESAGNAGSPPEAT